MRKLKQVTQLPKSLNSNKVLIKLSEFLSSLGPQSSFMSYLLLKKGNGFYFINKDNDFPFIPLDWTAYTLMRVSARSIISSGTNLRAQPDVYNENMGTYGRQDLAELYQLNVRQPINVFVYTKCMKKQDIEHRLNQKYLKYVPFSDIDSTGTTIKQICQKIHAHQLGPAIHEYGQVVLRKSNDELNQNENHFIEMVILSLMEGPLDQKYINNQCSMKFLQKNFVQVWDSGTVDSSNLTSQEDANSAITLRFLVYVRKDKATLL